MKTINIGRSPDNDISLETDKMISAHHLKLTYADADRMFIEDLESTNGTFVNGKKIPAIQPYPIQKNDVIKIGQTVLPWQNYLKDVSKPPTTETVLDPTPFMPQPRPISRPPLKRNHSDYILQYVIAGLIVTSIVLLIAAFLQ